jgi:HD superfamily phosphohydrolase
LGTINQIWLDDIGGINLAGLEFSDTAIYDEIYVYIPLTKVELEIVDHDFFQRLNHIKQLGVGYRVFPGAQHTRFSHSLGVMYTIDRMLNSPLLKSELLIRENKQNLRVAALLHDIGHYPLSHLIETVMKKNDGWKHERLSAFVVNESSIKDVLLKYSIDPKEIGQIITGESPEPLFNQLMSSELDADRLDYLTRDSFHTGVAYGRFDLNRLIHTLALDKEGKLCIDKSGMHAAEGYIIGRYLMWGVVYTHRVTNAFEELIKRIYQKCIGSPFPSFDDVKKMIITAEPLFAGFDDVYIFRTINQKAVNAQNKALKEICKMYMGRKALSIAKEAQEMSGKGKRNKAFFILDQYSRQDKIEELAKESEVPSEWIYHNSPGTSLPNFRPLIEDQQKEDKGQQKEMSETLFIVNENKSSVPLAAIDTSIVYYLRNKSLETVRIYTKDKYVAKLGAVLEKKVTSNRKP